MRLWHFSSSRKLILQTRMCNNPVGLDVCTGSSHLRRLAWAFADRLCDKYHNHMSRLKYNWPLSICTLPPNSSFSVKEFMGDHHKKCWLFYITISNFMVTSLVSFFFSFWLFINVCYHLLWWFEPWHDKTNKMSVHPSKTHQPGHLPSWISLHCARSG